MICTDYTAIAPKCACGNTITKFFRSGKPGKFCAACREKQTGKHRSDNYSVACSHCGEIFQSPLSTGPRKRYCSSPCKGRANAKEYEALGERAFTCACCGNSFLADRSRKYCSTSCKWRTQTLKRKPDSGARQPPIDRTCTCRGCGKKYQNKRGGTTGQGSSYCSRECAFADHAQGNRRRVRREKQGPICKVYFRACAVCAKAWTSRVASGKVCSDGCRKAVARACSAETNARKCGTKPARACKCCSQTFVPTYGDKRSVFCGEACAKRVARRARGSETHRARARKAGVPYENVNKVKVFDRDGWRCQMCGKNTPRKRMGSLSSNAPELDHRVPLSKGGGHLYANVQCSCRACNGAKGNRSSAGQLPMFGIA